MARRRNLSKRGTEAGFSMVEMLMAALILAVGILGVSLMQLMALKATRGGQNLSTAAQVAERMLDQVELEGRLTWLNLTSNLMVPTALTTLHYLTMANGGSTTQYYDAAGQYLGTSAANVNNFFTVLLRRADLAAAGAATGGTSDFTVQVTFTETVAAGNQKINRNITLTRRIVHG